jgi:hypothetical protein
MALLGMGKSEEEKAAEREEQARQAAELAQRRDEAARAKAAQDYAASPVGQAEAAAAAGAAFFQTQIEVSRLDGDAGWGTASAQVKHLARPDLLGQIEAFGWRLENVGYVFIETGTTSTGRVLMSGEATAVRGIVLGIYLFRNANHSDVPPNRR